MEKSINTKINKSFSEIWKESYDEAEKSFSTGEIEEIERKYGVDEDEAAYLDRLCGYIRNQIALVRDRGRKIVLIAHNVKTHEDEVYEVSTLEDWCNVMKSFGTEFEETDDLDAFNKCVRGSERTKGWYVPMIKII